MRVTNKKGSIILETSIVLPVFVLTLLTMILIIRIISAEENIMKVFAHEASRISKESYIMEIEQMREEDSLDLAGKAAMSYMMRLRESERIEGLNEPVRELELKNVFYPNSYLGQNDLINSRLSFIVKIPLPLIGRDLYFDEKLLFREFVGKNRVGMVPMDYIEMEKEEDSILVYVFPRAGERYHKIDCSIIVNHPVEMLLCPSVREEYSPCQLCRPYEISDGGKVYCFHKTGEAYHRGNCTVVERYVIAMEHSEALEEGYTYCNICGGT